MEISDKPKFEQAVSETIQYAIGLEDETRRVKAIEKAAVEIKVNDSMQMANGQLSFVSRHSGLPRRVTFHGCSHLCECGNQYSYHRAAFEILSNYVRLLNEPKPENVFSFPTNKTQSTVLTYTDAGFTTSFCTVCAESDSIGEFATAKELKTYRGRITARHQDCPSRQIHPNDRKFIARRVSEIKQLIAEQKREYFHYTSGEIIDHYNNVGYREAA